MRLVKTPSAAGIRGITACPDGSGVRTNEESSLNSFSGKHQATEVSNQVRFDGNQIFDGVNAKLGAFEEVHAD
jgi:hypothetical protein